MARRLFKRRKAERVEASLLSFKMGYISLMITLVPFLLSIAVFARLAVLDLSLPKLSAEPVMASLRADSAPPTSPFALTVAIEEEGIAASNGSERLAFFPNRDGKLAIDALSTLIQKLKSEHPNEKGVIILSRPKTAYEDLVSIIDACRLAKGRTLFPEISLGEVS
jgi:biopolymer transport protein ExbD